MVQIKDSTRVETCEKDIQRGKRKCDSWYVRDDTQGAIDPIS